ESIKIQEELGADIMFAFDECTPPLASKKYIENSLERTHAWAKVCLRSRISDQALFGITQGSKFKDLRIKSAKYINSLGFDGYGIGGDLGESKEFTQKILGWTIPRLDENKPRHLLGIGHPEDMEIIIKKGIDLFDCIAPTHYARRGVAFTAEGRLDLRKSKYLSDKNPIDKDCLCLTCQNYRRNYISHLLRAEEITPLRLITFHNLFFFNTLVEKIREKIKTSRL
ncbi:MAG: tRNA guanosine(34) transglycosylase Tgt, partial [Patescibacteria group bacterium]